MQEAGGSQAGAAQTDNHNIFIGKLHQHCPKDPIFIMETLLLIF